MTKEQVHISIGVLAQSFAKQLKSQGIKFSAKKISHLQQDAHDAIRLHMRGYITEAMMDKMCTQIVNKIVAHIKDIAAGEKQT